MTKKSCEGPDTFGVEKILEAVDMHLLCRWPAGGGTFTWCAIAEDMEEAASISYLRSQEVMTFDPWKNGVIHFAFPYWEKWLILTFPRKLWTIL